MAKHINTQRALELCEHFGLDYLVKRINEHPNDYNKWKFDGVSCLCDKFAAAITGVDQEALRLSKKKAGAKIQITNKEVSYEQILNAFVEKKEWCLVRG